MAFVNKLKNAGFWQALQMVMSVVIQFVYIAIMARLLSKADYGLMALAGGFVGIGTIFSEGGMGAALIQRKKVTQKHINAALQGGIFVGILIFILFFFTSKYIALFFNEPSLDLIIKVVGLNLILHSVSGISMALLQKHFQFQKIAIVTIISTIIGYSFGLLLAINNYGVWSLVTATLITSFLNTLGFIYLTSIKLSIKFYFKEWKELFSFGSGMILLKIANYFNDQGLNLIVGKILSAELLGIFERASKIKILPSTFLGKILDTVMFPAMSEIQDEHERLFRIYKHSLGFVNSILMPVAVYCIFFSKAIVLILLGENWMQVVLPLQIMFVVIPFSSSGRMADSVIRAKGLIYKNVARKYIYVVVLITTTALGAYFYGIIGAAFAVTFSFLFNYIIMLFLVKNIFQRSIKEIFLIPIITGIKLSVIVLLLIIMVAQVFNNYLHEPIWGFIIITFFAVATLTIIAWKKPSWLGKYIGDTIDRLFNKK